MAKLCPLIKEPCKEKTCQLWFQRAAEKIGECSITAIAIQLKEIRHLLALPRK